MRKMQEMRRDPPVAKPRAGSTQSPLYRIASLSVGLVQEPRRRAKRTHPDNEPSMNWAKRSLLTTSLTDAW